VEYEPRLGVGWRSTALFTTGDRAADLKGKTFSVLLPVVVDGQTEHLFFSFSSTTSFSSCAGA
jgi:hypothetical protein